MYLLMSLLLYDHGVLLYRRTGVIALGSGWWDDRCSLRRSGCSHLTGGGTGMGRGSALVLAKHGADVVLARHGPDPLNRLPRRRGRWGDGHSRCPPAITAADVVAEGLIDATLEEFGRSTLSVNCPGGARVKIHIEVAEQRLRPQAGLNFGAVWRLACSSQADDRRAKRPAWSTSFRGEPRPCAGYAYGAAKAASTT